MRLRIRAFFALNPESLSVPSDIVSGTGPWRGSRCPFRSLEPRCSFSRDVDWQPAFLGCDRE